jgi:hypothetical protein
LENCSEEFRGRDGMDGRDEVESEQLKEPHKSQESFCVL